MSTVIIRAPCEHVPALVLVHTLVIRALELLQQLSSTDCSLHVGTDRTVRHVFLCPSEPELLLLSRF